MVSNSGVKINESLDGVNEMDNGMQCMMTDNSEIIKLDTSTINVRSVSKLNWSTNSIVPDSDKLR